MYTCSSARAHLLNWKCAPSGECAREAFAFGAAAAVVPASASSNLSAAAFVCVCACVDWSLPFRMRISTCLPDSRVRRAGRLCARMLTLVCGLAGSGAPSSSIHAFSPPLPVSPDLNWTKCTLDGCWRQLDGGRFGEGMSAIISLSAARFPVVRRNNVLRIQHELEFARQCGIVASPRCGSP